MTQYAMVGTLELLLIAALALLLFGGKKLPEFQADFLLTNGWIDPLLVGGYAPFSPALM